jgi:CRP/FNR family transcriptional regulator, cyclic AMP receptor protein
VLFSHDTKADALGACPFFAGLSRSELLELAKISEDLEVDAGKALTREGQSGSEFFVIVDGEVSVTKSGQEIRTLGPGDFFGEISLVSREPRTATVTATSPVRALVITDRSFRRLLDDAPRVQTKVMEAMAERLAPETL